MYVYQSNRIRMYLRAIISSNGLYIINNLIYRNQYQLMVTTESPQVKPDQLNLKLLGIYLHIMACVLFQHMCDS